MGCLAIALRPDHRVLLGRSPIGRFPVAHGRYCPACLRDHDGRGPIIWRLPWSFACPQHRVLLVDLCPACHRPPRPWNVRRLGPPTPGACTRDDRGQSVTFGHRGGVCGTDLTHAPTAPLPAAGLVLVVHRHLAELMTSPRADRPTVVAELRQVFTVASRALLGLHTLPDRAPRIVHAVLAECGTQLPDLADATVGGDATATAVAATLAHVALDETHRDHDALFDWILHADGMRVRNRQYTPGTGARARRWAWAGPDLVSRVLSRLDGGASLHARLRYRSATPRPCWPDLPATAIARRAAMIPAMLWPGWTIRLLPRPTEGSGGAGDVDPRTSAFRRGCASFLLLPGGPPQMNFERVGPLLGNHHTDTDRGAVERRLYHERDLTPLASILAQLAIALDTHGSPIDYARRRALFTDTSSVTLDLDAYTRLRLRHGWSTAYAPRVAVLRWYLLMLLTGAYPTSETARKPFGHHCTQFRYQAPPPLREFLRQQAHANLAAFGITDEPLTWEPPADWIIWPTLPGADPASISLEEFAAILATGGSVHDTARALGLTPEHVRCYCEITDTGTPPTTANGIPLSQTREQILEPVRLRDLYERQNLPLAEIAEMAGCATVTIRRLLAFDGVPRRRSYRRPAPEWGITREWLRREYVDNLRSIGALARERGVTASYLMSLAKNWGLPIRHHGEFSGIGHLNLPAPPSPAIRAVTMRTGALRRLALITQIPGHPSLAAAARTIYDGRDSVLREQVRKIETAAGFPIIDRSNTPLSPTDAGRGFIREALQILQAAREQAAAPTKGDVRKAEIPLGHAEVSPPPADRRRRHGSRPG